MSKLSKKECEKLAKSVSQAERDRAHAEGNSLPDKSYPINNKKQLHSAAVLASSGHGNVSAAKALIRRRAKELGVELSSLPGFGSETKKFEVKAPLWKAEHEQFVYGVVLTPGVEDSQGDIVDEADIRKAAHKWLVEFRKHDVQHNGQPAAVDPVESFVAPMDMVFTDPDGDEHTVLKGSWVLGAKVHDGQVWQDVLEKKLTGWSIGGTGERVPLAA